MPPELAYDLEVQLHDGSALPIGNVLAVTDVSGQVHLTTDTIELREFQAHRGKADLFAAGSVDNISERPMAVMTAGAKNLSLDDSLYKLLPQVARRCGTRSIPME